MSGLRTVFFHVTKACNLRCRYCYFSAANPLPDELSTAELCALWPDVVAARPEKLVITGGEPLLRADLLDVLRALGRANSGGAVRVCLNTNGRLVTADVALALRGLVHEVRVSVDGFREANDAQRGDGSFDAAVGALEMLRAEGVPTKALVTVTPASLDGLGAWLATLVRRGVTAINVNPTRPVGRAGHELTVTSAEVAAAIERAMPAQARRPAVVEDDVPQSTCGVGHFVNVMPNGDVYPCHVLTDPARLCGSLRTQTFAEICGPEGLLARFRALDLRALAPRLPALVRLPLLRAGGCLGEVAAASPQLRAQLPAGP